MLSLCIDILRIILNDLNDKEKILLLSTKTAFNKLKKDFTYHDRISAVDIQGLSYARNFKYSYFNAETIIIPKIVTHLTFNDKFNQPIKNIIPATVTHLEFGSLFNMSIKNNIPESVTHLTMGMKFNKSINTIPHSITHLKLGYSFNKPVENCIPQSVTHLTFGFNFNRVINNCIPNSVTHLVFDVCFNKSIKDCVPSSVTHITLGYSYDKSITEIPSTVMEIRMFRQQYERITDKQKKKIGSKIILLSLHKYLENVDK
jgi:hypothetical protein